jgi:Mg/Co/Ni transporter MgtE
MKLISNSFRFGCFSRPALVRVAVFLTPLVETIAITSSLFLIVFISIVLGAILPLIMRYLRIDPAHSSTTVGPVTVEKLKSVVSYFSL